MINRIKDRLQKLEQYNRYIFIVILLIQAALMIYFFARFGVIIEENSDTPTYTVPAENLLKTGHLNNADGIPTFLRTPGYIWFLALIYAIAGTGARGNAVVVILQMLMLLASNYLIYTIVREKFCGIAGAIASILFVVDVNFYNHALTLMTDVFFAFLLVLSLFFFSRYTSDRKDRDLVFSTLIICYALLTRPQIMYIVWIYLILLLIAFIRKYISLKCLLVYTVVLIAVFGGWKVRNYRLFGVSDFNRVKDYNQFEYYSPIVYADLNDCSIDEARAVFNEELYAAYPDFDSYPIQEEVRIKKEIGSAYLGEHLGRFILSNFKGLFLEMVGPGVSWIEKWGMGNGAARFIELAVAGTLLLTYLIYAVGFLGNIKKLNGFDWIVFLTASYLMVSTASLGYSRYRIAFYPFCLVGGLISWRHYTE